MFELIPLEYYKSFWYNLMLLIALLVFIQSQQYELIGPKNLRIKNTLGIILLVFIVLYMGLRPISGFYFTDMRTYANVFEGYQAGEEARIEKDYVFEYFMKFCSAIMSVEVFFLLCCALYIYPMYRISKKYFEQYWFYAFFVFLASFSFWAYGTNGIRNGIATSIFLLGLSQTKRHWTIALIVLSFFFHKSMILPMIGYFLSLYVKENKYFLFFWLATIPLSIALGGFWESFFLSLGFGEEDRFQVYLGEDAEIAQVAGSFRWDFLLYGATGVFTGWFFIFKKKFDDPLYKQLFNIYLFANGFWILVIRANFSNRFAYLSWFMLGLIIIYPWLKMQFYHKQHTILANIIFAYFLFTYIVGLVLA